MYHFTLLIIAAAALLVGCTGNTPNPTTAPPSPAHLIMGEGDSTSDGLSVSNGNVIVRTNQPGIAFATVTTPGQSKRVAYFLVFNHGFPNADVKTESESGGSSANTFHSINTFDNVFTVRYDVALKEGTQAIETERISYGNVTCDLSDGRVFLIDMGSSPARVTQLDLDLPTDVPWLKEANVTQQFGHDALNALREAEEKVDDFCELLEAKGK